MKREANRTCNSMLVQFIPTRNGFFSTCFFVSTSGVYPHSSHTPALILPQQNPGPAPGNFVTRVTEIKAKNLIFCLCVSPSFVYMFYCRHEF